MAVERADDLLEQQVDGHLHAGQRGLQLVADGRDHVALELVDEPELGHVGEHDRGAEGLLVVAADRQDARQEEPLLAVVAEAEGVIQAGREVVAAAAEHLGPAAPLSEAGGTHGKRPVLRR